MQPMLARQGASGRMLATSAHAGNGKRTASALQSSNSESLGSAIKLGQVGRDKERKEREDVELKPPWDLLPYSRDASAGYPDFYPSKGTEDEYKLTEKAITDGFENKAVVANESSGAAQDSIGQSMLETSTLQNFSQFILSVLQQRHKEGLIKTPTTFRVPPRVTLTDQKREQYLRDLANPSQSLRRLARGVPHGIRGRLLLEQVCSKSVPVNRAIWFIRVISVNELRAVKRKGLTRGAQESVESKWVVEWTGQVAAFLETIIEECGKEKKVEDQQRWRARMTYTLRLVTYLYAEQLIDQPNFLKWCLTYTEKSTIEVSPIIVILIGIFWDDLIARRSTGRKLTELLLDKVDMILKSSKSPILAPVITSISEKLQIILVRYPDYLIQPKRWSTLSQTLQKCLPTSAPQNLKAVYEALQLRNANLSDPELRPFLPDLEPPQARIVKLLDQIAVPVVTSLVANQVYSITMDPQLLLRTLCDYAITRFRPGWRRIYLVSSILAEWPFSEKLAVQDGVVRYFESRTTAGDEMQRLILLFTDLLERRVISYSWLLRRCIARGWTQNSDAKGYLRLLVELPIHNAPQSAHNTRDMILHRAQITSDTELQLVDEMIDALAGTGIRWMGTNESMDVEPGINDFDSVELEWLSSLTRNAKSVLATTIATRFAEAKAWEGQEYPRQLRVVIRILSVIQEFRRLHDVLSLAIKNNSRQDTLVTLIIAVATWHPPLEGMGLLPAILESLATNWRQVFQNSKLNSSTINLLSHLHTHLASSSPLLAQLLDEYTQSPVYIPLAYPSGPSASPLSDHGLENLAIRDLFTAEEAVRLLTPSGSFDATLFQRVLTATAKEATFDIAGISSFLDLLMVSDIAQVEELAKEWALEGIKSGLGDDGKGVWWIVANLVSVEMISVEDVIETIVQLVTNPSAGKELSEGQSLELLSQVYGLLCAESGTKLNLSLANFLSLRSIRHRISSNEACLQNLAILFRVLLTLAGQAPEDIRNHVTTVIQSPWMLRTAIHHPNILVTQVIEPIVAMGDTPALTLTISAFRSLLGASSDIEADFGETIEQIFKSTSEFSMNLCRINLRLVLEYSRLSNIAVGERSGELVERIIASVVDQGQTGKSGDLVKSLNTESKQMLRDHLEKSFLEAAPIPGGGALSNGQHPEIWTCEKVSSAFKLLEATTSSDLPEVNGTMDSRTVGKALLDKVKCIGGLLDVEEKTEPESDFNELVFGTSAPPVPSQKELIYCFILCLRILVLRWASMGVSDSIDLEAWIITLVALIEHPRVSKEKLLVSYIYDIILCFYDELQANPSTVNRIVSHFESLKSSLLETFVPFKRQNAFFDNLVMVKPSHSVPTEIPAKVWDNIESATLTVSENDGPFSLGLFDARERPREHSLWEPEAIRVGIS